MKEKIKCSVCGVNLNEETATEFGGEILCEHCLNEKSVVCDCCGTRIRRECADGDDYITLCNDCYLNRYTNCENCGVLISNDNSYCIDNDDDYCYCYNCYQKIINRPIKNYNYKPETIFYGDGSLYYGIELEIDKGGEFDEHAQKILDVGNSDGEKIYCKHDGSISDGFEIVSHAATMDYHLNHFPWQDIMTTAIDMGYRSHNTSTCGLHVHVSRTAFGKEYKQ